MKHIRKTLKHPKKYLYSHEQRTKSNIKALENLTSQFFQVHPDLPLIVRHVPTILTTPIYLCPGLWSQNLVQLSLESDMDSDVESDIGKYRWLGSESGFKSGKDVNGIFYD